MVEIVDLMCLHDSAECEGAEAEKDEGARQIPKTAMGPSTRIFDSVSMSAPQRSSRRQLVP
jgi:hypothetical protein